MSTFTYYDFFAGVGLAELGLDSNSWSCVWSNDIDPKKFAIYAQNFDADNYHLGDIAEVSSNMIPASADMAWASFPCQDLSLAGWRRGLDARRSGTFWAFHRIMSELHQQNLRPPLIVIENVMGLLYGTNFSGLCEALSELDMQFGAVVIDAKHFVPQSRPRVFVVAVDNAIDVSSLVSDMPTSRTWTPRPVINAWSSISPRSRESWRWWQLPQVFERVQAVSELIENEPTQVVWHTQQETEKLLSLMSTVNLEKVEQAQRRGNRRVGFLYKRTRSDGQRAEVRFDGIAGCLRTTYGGSSRQTVMIVEGGSVRSRLLSPREAARLMGVPDEFNLNGRYNETYRAMGDGVAVPAVAWLSEQLLIPLANTSRGFASVSDPDVMLAGG